jgi:triosephosphate isomerase (TIM)
MWAISTSGSHLHLEPADAAEAHDLVRRQLDARFGSGFGEAISVLFGGSISEINAQAYFAHPTIDGGLVGSGMQTVEGFCGVVGAFQNS